MAEYTATGTVKLEGDTSGLTNSMKQAGDESKKTGQEINNVSKQSEQLDARIKILQGTVGVLGGAVEGLTGALVLSAGASKESAEALESAAIGALAFVDGTARTITGIKDLNEGLGKLDKQTKLTAAAQKILGKAVTLATGPFGLIIAAIGAIIAILYNLRDRIEVVGKAFTWLGNLASKFVDMIGLGATEEEKLAEAAGKAATELNHQAKLAQAQGKSIEEVEKLKRQALEKTLQSYKKGTEEAKKAQQELDIFNAQADTDRKAREAKAEEEAAAKRKAAYEKRKAQEKANNDAFLALQQKLSQEGENLAAKTEQDKLKLALDRQMKEIDALKVSDERKNELRLAAEKNYQTQLGIIQDKASEERLKKETESLTRAKDYEAQRFMLLAETDAERLKLQQDALERERAQKVAAEDLTQSEIYEINALYTAKKEKLQKDADQAVLDNKKIVAQTEQDLLFQSIDAAQGALTALFGESKGVARANVLIDAAQAAVGIIQKGNSFENVESKFLPGAWMAAQFALLGATTIASLKQINSAKPGGGGAAAAAPKGAGSIARPAQSTAQVFNPAYNAGGFLAPTGTQQPPMRAYVLATDVTNSQQAQSQIERRRRIG